jgi:diaminohydroxyphosphoribosylaminopyrimidine deaminase/5-amino-6-(5-phosphoribosylamino)uracil reductase
VLAAGLRRVVIAMRDPDPRTRGGSIARLRRAGIDVRVGVEAAAARELNRGFVSRVERGRPLTILKLAASLDGRIATARGESRWITGPRARAWVHRLRSGVGAIAVGSGTALADDPELTARRGARVVHRPLRIVVDSGARTPPSARLLRAGDAGTAWILVSPRAPARRVAALERAGARVLVVPGRGAHLDLRAAWRALAREGVNEVLVEGGAGLAAALLRARLVDRLHWIAAPLLLGGDGRAALEALGVARLSAALELGRPSVQRLGPDLVLTANWE